MNTRNDRKRVAILMATYNGDRWLESQLRSIMQQTHADWILFPQDDRSTDSTLAILRAHSQIEPRIRSAAVATCRLGSAAANFVDLLLRAEWESCDYLALCDQDDIWFPDKLEAALAAMEATGAQGYSCDLVAFDQSRKVAWYLRKSSGRRVELDYLFQGASAGCTYVLTNQAGLLLRERIGQRRTDDIAKISHDWLIYAICRSMQLTWVVDTNAYVFYRQHSQNAYGARNRWQELRRKFQLVRTGWYRGLMIENGRYLDGSESERKVLERMSRLSWADRWWLSWRTRTYRRSRHEALLLKVLLLAGLI